MDQVMNQELLMSIIKSADIGGLNLSVRSHNGLKRSGIDTIGKLCQKTRLDLLQIEYISIRSVEEIEHRLSEIGLWLKPLEFEIATRKDWKREPIPNMAISFDLVLSLSAERYELLKRGNVPSNMDQWFIYYEKGILHFYRCSGLCYFTVKLHETSGVHHVKAYIHNLDSAKEWINVAPEMIKAILERYGDY